MVTSGTLSMVTSGQGVFILSHETDLSTRGLFRSKAQGPVWFLAQSLGHGTNSKDENGSCRHTKILDPTGDTGSRI